MLEFVNEILKSDHFKNESQIKLYFHIVVWIMLYKVILNFESVYVDEIL